MPRVLCAGHVNWDVTLFVDRLPEPDGESRVRERRQSGGGSAANVATALAGLDCAATILGSVGDDEQGHLARRDLRAADVDTTGLLTAEGETTTKYLLVDDDGEVSVLGAEGVNEAVTHDDVDPVLVRAADHVHLTAQRPETAGYVADIATEAGIPVSFDPGRRAADRDYDAVIDRADVLFLNEREATALGDCPDDRQTVTKYGTRGATLETADEFYGHPGFDLPDTDATGAGDAFAAGFLASRLCGDEPARSLAVGNACGALAARERGPKAGLTWEAVDRVLDGEAPEMEP
jgi:ribokinase